jgi:hypothetical protein
VNETRKRLPVQAAVRKKEGGVQSLW